MQTKAERVVADLFSVYAETPEILPNEIQRKGLESDRHRAICDYLAGMTDRFALQEHKRLFEPEAQP
jgi:dGTPase